MLAMCRRYARYIDYDGGIRCGGSGTHRVQKHVHVHKNTARRGWISALGVGVADGAASRSTSCRVTWEDMGEVRVHVRCGPRVSIPTSLPELALPLHLDKLPPIFSSHHSPPCPHRCVLQHPHHSPPPSLLADTYTPPACYHPPSHKLAAQPTPA